MTERLLAPRFLFRFSTPLHHQAAPWTKKGCDLNESHRLIGLSEIDGEAPFADVRAAWNEQGLFFSVTVQGKRQPLWCRDTRLDESDGLQVWIDTRATHSIHRASRFCHRFAFLPAGAGAKNLEPTADQLIINRARENAPPVRPRQLGVASRVTKSGYQLWAHLPVDVLQGFDPTEHPNLGFTYALLDRELGLQTFSAGTEYPYEEDPSTWATLELVNR